jgi:prepilin-type N-terminal cleavage/methylation domain-containing protein
MVKKSGFSLMELTIVIGLISLLILAISSTMLMSVVTSNRIRTATKTKQAGNYAIEQIQSFVRNAKSVKICDSANNTLTLINQDGGTTQYFLDSGRIASGPGEYLTPATTTTTLFNLDCAPSDTNATSNADSTTLINLSFSLQDTLTTTSLQNPVLDFNTSINIRN